MPAQFPGGTNTFAPNHRASGAMVVNFSRNPDKFALPRYTQIVPVKQDVGYYLEMTVEQAGRLTVADLADIEWPDGADAPTGVDGTESFNFKSYYCKRYAPAFVLGDRAVDQADWKIVETHSAIQAQRMMTARTQLAIAQLTTTGNYAASHTSAVASISGNTGTWAASTSARSDIKRSIYHACETILDSTLAVVEPADLQLVVSSGCAKAIALSQEIVEYLKGSPFALAQVRGEVPNKNILYGLPEQLYGVNLVIETTRKVTSRKGAANTARSAVLADATPFMCSRPKGLVGQDGSPSFATCSIFASEEMTVETKRDPDARRTLGRVVDIIGVVLTAPSSGFLFTSAV